MDGFKYKRKNYDFSNQNGSSYRRDNFNVQFSSGGSIDVSKKTLPRKKRFSLKNSLNFKRSKQIKRFLKHVPMPFRIVAMAMVLLIVSSILIPIYEARKIEDRYDISRTGYNLLPKSVNSYGAKLQYDSKSRNYNFNSEYTPTPAEISGDDSSPKIIAQLGSGDNKTLSVTDPMTKTKLDMKPLDSLAEPKKDNDRIIYPFRNLDATAVYTMRGIGVKEDILLSKYQGKSLTFSYELVLSSGTEARLEKDGSVGIYGVSSSLLGNVSTANDQDAQLLDKARQNNQKNNLLFVIPKPTVVEPYKKVSKATSKYELSGNKLTVKVVDLDKANYPLSVDPSVYIESARKLMRGNNETNIDFDVNNELIQKSQTTGARIDAWSSTTSLTSAVYGQGTAVAGGFIYSAGGVGSPTTNSVSYSVAGTDTYVVPAGVNFVTVKVWGGGGGGGAGSGGSGSGRPGGGGGYVSSVLSVTPGESLNIEIGSGGQDSTANSQGGDGGGYSAIKRSTTFLAQAGGGGGGGGSRGTSNGGAGGAGGGTNGVGGSSGSQGGGGGGGTASAGGTRGNAGTGGAVGVAGASNAGGNAPSIGAACNTVRTGTGGAAGTGGGGAGGTYNTTCSGAGGGGGGNYGGGSGGNAGGAANRGSGGGGGGSSLISGTSQVNTAGSGVNPGNLGDADRGTAGIGGNGGTNAANATSGADGKVIIFYTTPGSTTDQVSWAQFDSGTNAISSPNPGNGSCGGWCNNSVYNLPTALTGLSLIAYNGFLYAIGGSNSSGTPQTNVYIAKLGAKGEPQLWHPSGGTPVYWYTDTSLSNARSYFGAAAYNNKMYIVGGLSGVNTVLSTNTVQSANINPTGTLTTWSSSGMTALTSARYGITLQVYNDAMYAIGGSASFGGTPVSTVEYSKLNSDGTMNSWVNASSLLNGGKLSLGGSYTTIWGGYIYAIGGCNTMNASGYCTSISSDVQLASINADGSLSEWNTIIGLSNDRFAYTAIAWQGGIYRLGGCRSQDSVTGICTDTAIDVTYGVVNATGEASTVATSAPSGTSPCTGSDPYSCDLSSSAVGNMLNVSVIINGYLYIMGGCSNNACTSYSNGIVYQSIGSDGTLQKPASCSGTYMSSYCDAPISLPNALGAPGVTTFGNKIYVIGGFPNISNISYITSNPDGSLGTWSNVDMTTIGVAETMSYTFAYSRANPNSAGSIPGNLYIFGGCTSNGGIGCSTYTGAVYKCNLNTAGVPSGCTTSNQLQIGKIYTPAGGGATATSAGIAAFVGTVYANYIYIMGGLAPGITDLTTVYYAKFDDNNNIVAVPGSSSWKLASYEILVGRRRGAGYGYNGYLYVTGGYDGTDALADIEFAKIDVSTGDIAPFKSSSVSINKRWGLTVPVSNSYAYVIGGCISGAAPSSCSSRTNSIQTFQMYNNDSGAVREINNASDDTFAANTDRWGASAVVLNGYIYVAGGCISATDCTNTTNDIQYAPISSNDGSIGTWSSTTNALPAGRAWGKLLTIGGTLYYLGGQNNAGTAQSTIYYTSTFSGGNISAAWSTASGGIGDTSSGAAQARTKFGAAVWNNRIYVVAGKDGSGNQTNTVYFTSLLPTGGNIAADSWRQDTDVPDVARYGATLTAYANNLYLVGGNNGTNYLSDVQFASIGYKTGTISQTGTTVTGSGTSFNSEMVGSTIQYRHDGSTAQVTGYTNASTITVNASKSVPAGTSFTIIDGSINTWIFTTSLPGSISEAESFAANGYIYIVGGRSGTATCSPKITIAPISANTTIASGNDPTGVGDWYETNVRYAGGRYGVALAYDKGKMYTMGGGCTSPQAGTYNTGTITQSGTTVTGTGTNWTDNYIGATITYADASTATVVSVNATNSIVVSKTKTIGSAQAYSLTSARHTYWSLKSQPQLAKYSRMIDTDTDVFPTKWLLNGLDNSVGARWYLKYRSMHDISDGASQQNPNEDCGTSSTMPVMTTWGQETDYGPVTLGTPGTYTPKNTSGGNINCARYFYFSISIDASQTFGYPEDVNRGPTISDLSLFFTADPSKRMRHGKTFTGGEQQPLDTPF